MKTINSLSLFLFTCFALVGCERDNLESEQFVENVFPQELSLKEYFQIYVDVKTGKSDIYYKLGALNENEWFIEDNLGNIQYYQISKNQEFLIRKDDFSGYVADFNAQEKGLGIELCSYTTDNGCTHSVVQYLTHATYSVDCGLGDPDVDTWPGLMGGALCVTVALIEAAD